MGENRRRIPEESHTKRFLTETKPSINLASGKTNSNIKHNEREMRKVSLFVVSYSRNRRTQIR
jgi:hypothetical protein